MSHIPDFFVFASWATLIPVGAGLDAGVELAKKSLQAGLWEIEVKFAIGNVNEFDVGPNSARPVAVDIDGTKYEPLPFDPTGQHVAYRFAFGFARPTVVTVLTAAPLASKASSAAIIGSVRCEGHSILPGSSPR